MQLDMFNYECQTPYVVNKPIRLIELFAGKGAQAKALERLKANFVHWRICEFDKYAVATYNAIHGTNFKTSDITQITAADLGITDTDKYEYIMTWSFPCQSLSVAGKRKGMDINSGTSSSLGWEVIRILKECKELPQVLLMENVPGLLTDPNFGKILVELEGLGYRNYYQKLNAKDYGIPQNRDRVFMVSTLGDYYYEFPKPIKLQLRLKDMLEPTVDEKYYLSEKMIAGLKRAEQREHGPTYLENTTDTAKCVTTEVGNLRHYEQYIKEPVILQQPHGYNKGAELEMCPSITTSSWESNNFLKEPVCNVVGNLNLPGRHESACRIHGIDGIAPACNTCGGGGRETKILEPIACKAPNIIFHDKSYEPIYYSTNNDTEIYYIVVNGKNIGLIKQGDYWYAIRKLTPLECFRLMGFDDEDFYKAKWGADWQTIMNIMNSNWSFEEKATFINKYKENNSNSQLYKIAGNSIVVQVLEHIFEMMLKENL